VEEGVSYQKVINSLKRRKKGSTAADISAATALPLSVVRELLPKAADEFSGHLRVTESGEILYRFPNGFISRYRGFSAVLRKITSKTSVFVKKALILLFKVWIMVMLIGYFVLFLAIALATVFIQIAAKSGSNDKSRGGGINLSAFDILWRIWFYNELTRPGYGNTSRQLNRQKQKNKQPLHKTIFSFVFGEDDPNKNWNETVDKAIISFLQSNNGVISLVEYMIFTGENSIDAEKSVLSFCSRYEGSPELTDEGTIVYRFENLLLQEITYKFDELSPPVKRLKTFSVNSKKMNGLLIAINAFNLIFGSYFLNRSLVTGNMIHDFTDQAVYGIYEYLHYFLGFIIDQPQNFICVVLGVIPLTFSLFFWIIPALRRLFEKKENESIKFLNFKRLFFGRIWSSPDNVEINSRQGLPAECNPQDQVLASDKAIKDICAVSNPGIEISQEGKTVYSFNELKREKQALEKYRKNVDMSRLYIGKTVFDTEDRVIN